MTPDEIKKIEDKIEETFKFIKATGINEPIQMNPQQKHKEDAPIEQEFNKIAFEILLDIIPSGCINLKSYKEEKLLIIKAMEIYSKELQLSHASHIAELQNQIKDLQGQVERLEQKPEEYIICAANYYNDENEHIDQAANIAIGFIVCGRRHFNCISTFAKIVGFPYTIDAQKIRQTEVQGFLTNTNRFVTRKQALQIATKANQLIHYVKLDSNIGLTSEDIY